MGHAATALSGLLNSRVDMDLPAFRLYNSEEASVILTKMNKGSFIVELDVVGDTQGKIIHVMESEFAEKVVAFFFGGSTPEGVNIDEMAGSMISEIGNITSGAYVNAIAEMTGMFVDITPPVGIEDLTETVMNFMAKQKDTEFSEKYITEISDKLVLLDNCFRLAGEDVRSHLVFLPFPNTIDGIIDKLREKYKLKQITLN